MDALTIAIIDDDYIDRLVSKRLIARISADINIIEFAGACEALGYLQEFAKQEAQLPDIVIVDLRMPILSGWDYLEHFQKIQSNLSKQPKHYIYTSSIDPADLNYRHQYVHGLYTKPFENSSLLKIIQLGRIKE